LSDRIVDEAIALAEDVGWHNVRLREVAARLDVPLAELGRRFRDADAVADAWFARARDACLAPPPPDFQAMAARDRLALLVLRWLDALAPHRLVTGQMLGTKLWPFHPHHWVPMVFDLSRTIQWFRDAGALDAGGRRRAAEEVGLTWLFVATLAVWVRDDSPGQQQTRRFLDRRLRDAETLVTFAFGRDDHG
jgi:AcrR family transcriptional regulator